MINLPIKPPRVQYRRGRGLTEAAKAAYTTNSIRKTRNEQFRYERDAVNCGTSGPGIGWQSRWPGQWRKITPESKETKKAPVENRSDSVPNPRGLFRGLRFPRHPAAGVADHNLSDSCQRGVHEVEPRIVRVAASEP